MRNIIPMELTDLNSSIDMAVRPTYGGLPKYGVASGDIASFITNINYPLKKLEADITAQQDLHGYSHPWAGGAGKNKLQNTATSKTSVGITMTVNADGTVSLSGTASGLFNETLGSLELTSGTSYTLSGCASGGDTTKYELRVRDASYNVVASDFGSSLTFTVSTSGTYYVALIVRQGVNVSNKIFKPMFCLSSATNPTTFEPYANICPIDGFDEVVTHVTGINIWDEEWEVGGISTTTGQNAGSTTSIRSKNYIRVLPSTDYYLKCENPSSYVWFYGKNKEFLSFSTSTPNSVFTTPSNCHYIRIRSGDSSRPATTYNHDISINYPSTDHDYHAYNGASYTTDLDGTRYGGTLDVTTGVLTITHGSIDMGSIDWTYLATYQVFRGQISGCILPAIGSNHIPISSAYKGRTPYYVTGLENGDIMYNSSGDNAGVFVKNTAYTDATAFKTAMAGQTIMYELATPQTVQLTPQEVETVCGQNNIWANSGQVYVEYHFVEDFEE